MSKDALGNLTNIAYPSSGSVALAYDSMNRLTNMVDGLGTTRFTYDAAGQLVTTTGPFSSDAMTNTYSGRRRIPLALQQPTGLWTNGFTWDVAGRLLAVASPAERGSVAHICMLRPADTRLPSRRTISLSHSVVPHPRSAQYV